MLITEAQIREDIVTVEDNGDGKWDVVVYDEQGDPFVVTISDDHDDALSVQNRLISLCVQMTHHGYDEGIMLADS
jgi:hypothetical protein